MSPKPKTKKNGERRAKLSGKIVTGSQLSVRSDDACFADQKVGFQHGGSMLLVLQLLGDNLVSTFIRSVGSEQCEKWVGSGWECPSKGFNAVEVSGIGFRNGSKSADSVFQLCQSA